jgi:hypothetical protein
MVILPGLWETVGMKIPESILIRKVPTTSKCPACSKTFIITDYASGNVQEQLAKMIADYEAHFTSTHGKEDASQAAARIVREATEK